MLPKVDVDDEVDGAGLVLDWNPLSRWCRAGFVVRTVNQRCLASNTRDPLNFLSYKVFPLKDRSKSKLDRNIPKNGLKNKRADGRRNTARATARPARLPGLNQHVQPYYWRNDW